MESKLKAPCKECPWRRKHMAGWLAQFSPEWFTHYALNAPGLACHRTVKVDMEDGPTVAYCHGALQVLRNAKIMPRDPAIARAWKSVEPSSEVFASLEEFVRHHEGAKIKSWELV